MRSEHYGKVKGGARGSESDGKVKGGERGTGSQGRIAILRVHARDKAVSADINYNRIARACAGFTGAQLMNLMNVAAIVTVRRGGALITENDVFQVPPSATHLNLH